MVTISATEFKKNLGKYLEISKFEDVFIMKNGKIIAKLTNPKITPLDRISGVLKGKVDPNITDDEIRWERLKNKWEFLSIQTS